MLTGSIEEATARAYAELLMALRKLIRLSVAEEALVRKLFVLESYPKHTFFLREGEICRKVGFISRGLFRYYLNREQAEHTYSFGQEGDFVSNYASLLPAQLSTATIQALDEALVLTISYDNLQRFYREVEEGQKFGRLVAESLFVYLLSQLVSFYEDSPEERYRQFQARYPALQQRLPQYIVASYVGVQPQSLSRIRRRAAQKNR